MAETSLSGDRAWCEATLPRVSRTFALNIRLLAGPLREAVSVGYLLCRTADTIEDAWPGTAAEIEVRFGLLLEAVAGDGAAVRAGTLALMVVVDIPGIGYSVRYNRTQASMIAEARQR